MKKLSAGSAQGVLSEAALGEERFTVNHGVYGPMKEPPLLRPVVR